MCLLYRGRFGTSILHSPTPFAPVETPDLVLRNSSSFDLPVTFVLDPTLLPSRPSRYAGLTPPGQHYPPLRSSRIPDSHSPALSPSTGLSLPNARGRPPIGHRMSGVTDRPLSPYFGRGPESPSRGVDPTFFPLHRPPPVPPRTFLVNVVFLPLVPAPGDNFGSFLDVLSSPVVSVVGTSRSVPLVLCAGTLGQGVSGRHWVTVP